MSIILNWLAINKFYIIMWTICMHLSRFVKRLDIIFREKTEFKKLIHGSFFNHCLAQYLVASHMKNATWATSRMNWLGLTTIITIYVVVVLWATHILHKIPLNDIIFSTGFPFLERVSFWTVIKYYMGWLFGR